MAYHYDQGAPAKLSATAPSTFINKRFLRQPVPNNLRNLSSLPRAPGNFRPEISAATCPDKLCARARRSGVPFVNYIVTLRRERSREKMRARAFPPLAEGHWRTDATFRSIPP